MAARSPVNSARFIKLRRESIFSGHRLQPAPYIMGLRPHERENRHGLTTPARPPRSDTALIRMRRMGERPADADDGAVRRFPHLGRPKEGWWGYIRAFAEAAMVGGLADWFAVTAIFRRPLGLPIPHTAVIPRNQPRIADAVGRFIADNFLKPDLVAERVKDKDLSAGLGKWLADPAQSAALASGFVSAVPGVLDALDDETVAAFLREQAATAASGAQRRAGVWLGARRAGATGPPSGDPRCAAEGGLPPAGRKPAPHPRQSAATAPAGCGAW